VVERGSARPWPGERRSGAGRDGGRGIDRAPGELPAEEVDEPAESRGGNVIDLMAALKASVESKPGRAAPARKTPASAKAKRKSA
jgi:hypothetical protein